MSGAGTGPALYDPAGLDQFEEFLTAKITTADKTNTRIVNQIAPELIAVDCVGPQSAAQLLITAGSNPDRLTTEAQFACLTGVAPIPASSGKTGAIDSTPAATAKPTTPGGASRSNRRQHDPATNREHTQHALDN